MITLERCGVVCEPSGDPLECEGVLNPAGARLRDGSFMLYPRVVAAGNVSRVGLFAISSDAEAVDRAAADAQAAKTAAANAAAANPAALPSVRRLGYALEPAAAYEIRGEAGGFGCEDPRVTFLPLLDAYVMAYTAYGPAGPRIAVALSHDGRQYERVGLLRFAPHLHQGADKDAAFFPEPVLSPDGVPSLALYHRPMTHTAPPVHPVDVADEILAMPPAARECIRIAYIPLDPVLAERELPFSQRHALLDVRESIIAVVPAADWGRVKIGAGSAPVRTRAGWFSLYHGVDVVRTAEHPAGTAVYTVGAVLHDFERPHLVTYVSPEPLCAPETDEEVHGTVANVVFPTVLDARPNHAGDGDCFDVYYGMADTRIGLMRLTLSL